MVTYVFISSTFEDLQQERAIICSALHELSISVRALGITLLTIDLGSRAAPEPPVEHCLREVQRCDVMIVVVGHRYGSLTDDGRSVTEAEYDEALSNDKPVLVYFRDENPRTSSDEVEEDEDKITRLRAFKSRLEENHIRDKFLTPEQLRGHVFRDLLRLVLEEQVGSSHDHVPYDTAVARQVLECLTWLKEGKFAAVSDSVTRRRFQQDLQRFGMMPVYKHILMTLLEFDRLEAPTYVTDTSRRAELLLAYITKFSDSSSARIAQFELDCLDEAHRDPRFCFELSRVRAEAIIRGGPPRDVRPFLNQMRRKARAIGEPHTSAKMEITLGRYFRSLDKHKLAHRRFWKGIRHLLREEEICPFCLAQCFIEAGIEHGALKECTLATDRLAKALMVAQRIPDGMRQSLALLGLAEIFEQHGEIRNAVAALTWMSRVQAEVDPKDDDAQLEIALGAIARRQGFDNVRLLLSELKGDAESVVMDALAPFNVHDFADKLGIGPSQFGDHW